MPSWNDLSSTFNTLREIDINAIREESEQPLSIACIGTVALFETVERLLSFAGTRRYGPVGESPLVFHPLPLTASSSELGQANMVAVLLDGREPLSATHHTLFDHLDTLTLPILIVSLYSERTPEPPAGASSFATARIVAIADSAAPNAADLLATALLDRLPGEFHLAAARRLPALRPLVARNLVNTTSFANASYALASGLPEQIPLLSIPFAAADILVLTKNQALMVYKLALAHGAPPDFQSRIREVLPVVGGAYLWRQLARSLVGLIPIWGLVPKIAIAYAGTYTTGVAAWRWYANGELISGAQLKRVSQEALRQGREGATRLIEQARAQGQQTPVHVRQWFQNVRRHLPGGKKQPALNPPPEVNPPSNNVQE